MTTTFDRSYVDSQGYEHRYPMHDHAEDETVQCAYCGADVPGCTDCPNAPPAEDADTWADLAQHHRADCEWIATRSHQID